jgi:hypothetical protein
MTQPLLHVQRSYSKCKHETDSVHPNLPHLHIKRA